MFEWFLQNHICYLKFICAINKNKNQQDVCMFFFDPVYNLFVDADIPTIYDPHHLMFLI
jgi:hypothetical protein